MKFVQGNQGTRSRRARWPWSTQSVPALEVPRMGGQVGAGAKEPIAELGVDVLRLQVAHDEAASARTRAPGRLGSLLVARHC